MNKLVLAAAIILSPLLDNTALACGCPFQPDPSPEEMRAARWKAFDDAAAVFSGKVIGLEENKVRFKVEKIWKGDPVDEIKMVIQERGEGGEYVATSCDYSYDVGERYVVYAYGTPAELRTYVCSRTRLLKNGDQEMKGLDEIRLPEIRNTEEAGITGAAESNDGTHPTRDTPPTR